MRNYRRSAALLLCILACLASQAKDYAVTSPNGHLKATGSDNGRIEWTITHDGVTVLAPSAISIQTTTGSWGTKTRIQKARQRSINETINTVAYKRAVVNNKCNELTR